MSRKVKEVTIISDSSKTITKADFAAARKYAPVFEVFTITEEKEFGKVRYSFSVQSNLRQ